jgi:hypothetical protein
MFHISGFFVSSFFTSKLRHYHLKKKLPSTYYSRHNEEADVNQATWLSFSDGNCIVHIKNNHLIVSILCYK